MTGRIANPTQGARVPLKQRYVSSTSPRAVYRIPKLGDSSQAWAKPIMAPPDSQGSPVAKYPIAGETFFAKRKGRRVLITHPQWSLMGRGTTLAAAEEDLRAEAREVARILGSKPPELLSKEANRLYRFTLRIS